MHPASDFNMDVSICCDSGGEIILFHKIFWEVAYFEAHIFVAEHWSVEVEIFIIYGCEICNWRRGDTVVK